LRGEREYFSRHFLSDYLNSCYTVRFRQSRLTAEAMMAKDSTPVAPGFGRAAEARGAEEKNAEGGQRKPLKALDPDKRIKGNQSLFL
jgi:hypothetical protein